MPAAHTAHLTWPMLQPLGNEVIRLITSEKLYFYHVHCLLAAAWLHTWRLLQRLIMFVPPLAPRPKSLASPEAGTDRALKLTKSQTIRFHWPHNVLYISCKFLSYSWCRLPLVVIQVKRILNRSDIYCWVSNFSYCCNLDRFEER